MKVTVALFLTLVSVLAGQAQGEYRVKVHPPIPPPPPPPIKFSPLKGGGHRWSSNSLGPPRYHHHHHHHPHHLHHHPPHHHGGAFSAFPHGGPSPPKALIRPIYGPPPPHHHHPHHHHHVHAPSPAPVVSHPHPLPPHLPSLVHHHHHHHLPPSPSPRPSIKIPWKGPQGGGGGGGKDTFHPSPPDGAQNIVATHQTVDDNKGPIHTIPAPNLGPSGGHVHSRPVFSLSSFGGHDSGFQTGHGIGQGLGDAGGPYPNPVYGKPITVNLTYHEPMATPEAQAQHNAQIPTITIQSSHGYEVHEHGIDNFVTPAPVFAHVTTIHPNGAFFAPDPDPSLPAPKVPFTLDPHSHPSNGNSPPDLPQEIPQHLLTLYGFNQEAQNVHLQPQVQVQEQHQVHQVTNFGATGDGVQQGGGHFPADLGGQLLLSQALAQYQAQIQPDTYSQVNVHQQHFPHQQVQVAPDSGAVHQAQITPQYAQVSVQQAPLISSTHETVYQTVNAPQVSGVIDAQQGTYSTFGLFDNSPVNSPVLDSLKEHFHQSYPTSTPAPVTSTVASNHFQYQLPVSTTIAPPTSTPASNAIYGHQQQQFVSTTVAPAVNNIDFQPQIHDFTHSALANGQNFNDLYHNLGSVALEGHQAQAVSVTNPGQAGYISAAYHNQHTGNAAVPQVQTQVYSFGHDSFSAGSSHKTASVDASSVNSLASADTLKKGAETVRPSSSSSFYSEKSVRGRNQDSKKDAPANQQQGAEDDSEYYDEDEQEVGSEDVKKSVNPQPSGYSVYETYDETPQETVKETNDQEYDDGQYEDYPTQTKNNQKEENQSNLDTDKKRKLPITNYNQNIEYGTRLKPKKNN